MNKYKSVNGDIAILVSPGYGAGWSTWNVGDQTFLTMDKTLVEMHLNNATEDEVHNYIKEATGNDLYMGGWSDIEIQWLPEGSKFLIAEYDGYESLTACEHLSLTA